MSRPIRVLLTSSASIAIAAFAAACGTERIKVPKAEATYGGAVLFSQRCSGCHTLSYAGTHGSAPNVRTHEAINGPNFDIRCERPVGRVLYAIENGGFSGAYMPQNIVIGHDATAVAQFVSKYAGRQAPKLTGQSPCGTQPIGSIPPPPPPTTTTTSTTRTTSVSGARGESRPAPKAPKGQPARTKTTTTHR